MPICSFYYKTNIVILACTSDIFPPDLPSCQNFAKLMNWLGLWESAGSAHGGCRPYDTGSKHLVTYVGKNVVHECRGS